MCTPLGSVDLATPVLLPVAPRAAAASVGLLAADAAALPIQWIYSQAVLQEAATATGGFLRFYDIAAAQRLYDDARVPAGRAMCVTGKKRLGDISLNAELYLLVVESLASCDGDLDCLDLDKRFFEHFGPGGAYVGYIDSSVRRKLRLIDEQALRECPTRDLSTTNKFMQVVPVGQGPTDSTTARVCPFASKAEAKAALPEAVTLATPAQTSGCPYASAKPPVTELPPSQSSATSKGAGGCPYAGGKVAPSATSEPWKATGVDDAQSPALAAALAVACVHAGLRDEELLPRVDAAVRSTHANGRASMYGRAAARLLAGVIRGESLEIAAAAAAAVPRCPLTAERLRCVLEMSDPDSVAAATHLGTECHLEMAVPAAMHAILHAASFEDGIERTLSGGGDVVGRASLVGCVLGAHFGVPADMLSRLRPEHHDRLVGLLEAASGEQVATRCPVAKDDAPEFMHDMPVLGQGDLFPVIDENVPYISTAGESALFSFSSRCGRGPCLVCVFDTTCCVSTRFALPEVERRVWQPFAAGQSKLPCVGIARGAASSEAMDVFRQECTEKQLTGDRHIRTVSMPLLADPDSTLFAQLAKNIVPRFYLLDHAGSIRAATVGYDPSATECDNAVSRLLQEAQELSGAKL